MSFCLEKLTSIYFLWALKTEKSLTNLQNLLKAAFNAKSDAWEEQLMKKLIMTAALSLAKERLPPKFITLWKIAMNQQHASSKKAL